VRILATSDLGAAIVPLPATYGESGTCAGLVALLERERARVPVVWLDLGDLVVGSPAYPLLGERPWPEVAGLPIDVSVPGNHEFDDGLDALLRVVPTLGFPLVCANLDIGLPARMLLDTAGGPIGVIGLTHPHCDRFSDAPPLAPDWPARVAGLARELRADGARHVVALLHDGVEWWPDSGGVGTRTARLETVVRPWAAEVDLILGGHNFAAWTGELAGTPAGEPHLFANSVVVVDLAERAVVRGVFRVPPVRPAHTTPAVAAIDAAATRVVGELPERWETRTGAARYLPHLLAAAFRAATTADAGFVLPSFHGIQAPVDGAIAALGPGPVTELDVLRLFAARDYELATVAVRPGELRDAAKRHWELADPRNAAADALWWNWCRMPAGISGDTSTATRVAVIPGVASRMTDWIGHDLEPRQTGIQARDALVAALA
jgi:2',3'-cyclic-nucleotide 2'-phosphodiesterase (5'-nucleotidase family)